MEKRKLVKEISHATKLKTQAVKDVLDAFEDIVIRECVVNGKFKYRNLFSVDNHIRKERSQYNVQTGQYIKYPETSVLNISLSPKINSYYRWKQRHEFNQKYGLTIEDWQKMKQEMLESSNVEENE